MRLQERNAVTEATSVQIWKNLSTYTTTTSAAAKKKLPSWTTIFRTTLWAPVCGEPQSAWTSRIPVCGELQSAWISRTPVCGKPQSAWTSRTPGCDELQLAWMRPATFSPRSRTSSVFKPAIWTQTTTSTVCRTTVKTRASSIFRTLWTGTSTSSSKHVCRVLSQREQPDPSFPRTQGGGACRQPAATRRATATTNAHRNSCNCNARKSCQPTMPRRDKG